MSGLEEVRGEREGGGFEGEGERECGGGGLVAIGEAKD